MQLTHSQLALRISPYGSARDYTARLRRHNASFLTFALFILRSVMDSREVITTA